MANKSIEDAILAINPDAAYRNTTPDNTSGITWIAGTAPIAAETLEAKKVELQAAEDARSDRSPGEFYQLDVEMSFVEQEDVFKVIENLFNKLFSKFSNFEIPYKKFPKITFEETMLKYGTDKPDLRNPLLIYDVSEIFKREDVKFDIFKNLVKKGNIVRAVIAPQTLNKPRSFFDNID